MTFIWEDGANCEHNYVYFNGKWKNIYNMGYGEIIEEGGVERWAGNYNLSGYILLIIGTSIIIIACVALIFEINIAWKIAFRVLLIIGSLIASAGAIIHLIFVDYATAIEPYTIHINYTFLLMIFIIPIILFFGIFSLVGMLFKMRRRRIERSGINE